MTFAHDEAGRVHAVSYVVWDRNAAFNLMGGADPELSLPLPPPPPDETQLTVYVQLKPPPQPAAAVDEGGEQVIPLEKWHALDALWKAILGLEASIDATRLGMDALRAESLVLEQGVMRPAHPVEGVSQPQPGLRGGVHLHRPLVVVEGGLRGLC